MKNDNRAQQKQQLKSLSQALFQDLKADEHLSLSYSGETSLFMRLNHAKVRQISEVSQGTLAFNFIAGQSHTEVAFSLTGDLNQDLERSFAILEQCRTECQALPADPFLVLPQTGPSSEEDHPGNLPSLETLSEKLLKPAADLDLAGIFISGTMMRASINSKGQFHWFSTDTFCFDYSLYTPAQKAIKAMYAGSQWDQTAYENNLQNAKEQLKILEKPSRKVMPGKYRVYFAPAAVAEFLTVLSWGGLSEKALREGRSPLKKLVEGGEHLSPHFSLEEDFSQGLVPRFNELGEIAPTHVPLIAQGTLASTLVNHRTAQEYGLTSNAANEGESLRSPRLHPGTLKESLVLSRLGTGLYISNLHYLNWSDLQQGRITGMTRYGCFWVEKGEIISPITDMRFDETFYNFFGKNVEEIGDVAHLIPQNSTYWERSLGGCCVPGLLVNDFSLTL
jgi:predicted Zn-dependent protease